MNDEPQIRSRSAAERECDQLRAERDQAITLLRAVRSHFDEHFIRDRWLREVRTMLDASGLLDDEGQQR